MLLLNIFSLKKYDTIAHTHTHTSKLTSTAHTQKYTQIATYPIFN